MHVVVRIVSVAAVLVFDERKAAGMLNGVLAGGHLVGENHIFGRCSNTYRRLEAERGAGMSQRTRRP